MRKIAFLLLAVTLVAVVAAAEQPMVAWKSQSLNFNSDVKVGTQLLRAGEYRVEHVMDGTQHVLVLTPQQGKDRAAVRIACAMKPLAAKAKQTEQHYRFEGNDKVLVSLIFKGDTVEHSF